MDDYSDRYYGLNRTLCTVLNAMRELDKTKNYGPLLSLVEEAQVMADRMESALQDVGDIKALHETRKKLLAEVKLLKADKKAAGGEESEKTKVTNYGF